MVVCSVLVANRCRMSLLVFMNTNTEAGGILKIMAIDDRLLFSDSLFISFSPTQLLFLSVNEMQPSNNNNIVCSFICSNQDVLPQFLDT